MYEANARVRDPVYGCVGAISFLQNQVSELQMQLAVAQAEILCIHMQQEPEPVMQNQQLHDPNNNNNNNNHPHHHQRQPYFLQNDQYLNFAASPSNVIQDSLQRESFFGHDMVS